MGDVENNLNIIKKHDILWNNVDKEPFYIKSAKGITCVDYDGNTYLNLNEISCSLGYHHLKFEEQIQKSFSEKLLGHIGNASEEKALLIKNILEATDCKFPKVFLASSGGECIDWAVKIARSVTNKNETISFWNALHGRSFAGASLSGIPLRKRGFGGGVLGTIFVPYPNCTHCTWNKNKETCNYECVDFIKQTAECSSSEGISAIIIEPFQPLDGMAYPSPIYFKALRELADDLGALIILDEVQSGFGRTGTMFAFQQLNIDADILVIGKGMSNGFGLGGLLLKEKVASKISGIPLSGGSADNDFNCAVINKVIEIFKKEEILNNVTNQGKAFKKEFEILQKELPKFLLDVKGIGLAIGLELPANAASEVVSSCKKYGVLLGRSGNNLLVRPPLVITSEEVVQASALICKAIRKVSERW